MSAGLAVPRQPPCTDEKEGRIGVPGRGECMVSGRPRRRSYLRDVGFQDIGEALSQFQLERQRATVVSQ
jgi:hypothetical protein